MNTRLGKPKPVTLKVLLDSGASESVICKEHVKKLRLRKQSPQKWNTPGGKMVTNQMVKTQFTLPELQDSKLIEWDWHVVENLGAHDAIIGRDIMEFLGIDIRFSDQTVEWDGASMPFKELKAILPCRMHTTFQNQTVWKMHPRDLRRFSTPSAKQQT